MARWQIEDFRNPSKEVLFELCVENFNELDGNYKNIKMDTNREAFRDILVSYGMQSYTDLLLDYQVKWFNFKDVDEFMQADDEPEKSRSLLHKIKISKILKIFLSQETMRQKSVKVSVSNRKDKVDIDDKDLLINLKEVFIHEFGTLRLNETKYSTEEAIEDLEKGIDWEFYSDYGVSKQEIRANSDLTKELIEDYKIMHSKPREITLDVVNEVLSELEQIQKQSVAKVGAKIKNQNIGSLAIRLSYLYKIKDFLNQDVILSIEHFPFSNKSCRFIYEYLEFWKLLNDDIDYAASEKENRTNYIKSLIKNYNIQVRKGTYENSSKVGIQFHNLLIDSFKKVKDGVITPKEFHDLITSF